MPAYKASMEVFAENEAKSPDVQENPRRICAPSSATRLLWDRFSEQRFSLYMTSVKL